MEGEVFVSEEVKKAGTWAALNSQQMTLEMSDTVDQPNFWGSGTP